MKFGLFIHMERMDRSLSHEQAFADLTELVKIADAGGFENAWIGEHHAMEFTIAPNPLVNLAYLAPLTKTIRLGTSTLIAPNWHPKSFQKASLKTHRKVGAKKSARSLQSGPPWAPKNTQISNSASQRDTF